MGEKKFKIFFADFLKREDEFFILKSHVPGFKGKDEDLKPKIYNPEG